MSKESLSDFEKVCKSLDVWRKSHAGKEIELARKAINDYIGQDNDRLLKLKAEAQRGDYQLFLSQNTAQGALIISFGSLGISALQCMKVNMDKFTILGVLSICVLIAILLWKILNWSKNFSYINYWRPYIIVVIEEIEENKR